MRRAVLYLARGAVCSDSERGASSLSSGGGPFAGQSLLAVLTFLVQHDSHHSGQLALLWKHAGLPAMRYT